MAPFSGKQKKKQLQEKRQRKKEQQNTESESKKRDEHGATEECNTQKYRREGSSGAEHNSDSQHEKEEYKYGADRVGIRSVFLKETAEEVAERKKLSYERLANRHFMGPEGIPFGTWFNMPGPTKAAVIPLSVEIPTRGWSVDRVPMSKPNASDSMSDCNNSSNTDDVVDEVGDVLRDGPHVDAREQARFKEYVRALDNYSLPGEMQKLQVSSYERNIDVWRQLWRTVELSDVVIIVTDARYPVVHLPLSLLHYIVRECRKACVVVLNKADLVPPQTLNKWSEFLQSYFLTTGVVAASDEEATDTGIVREIPLVPFTALPSEETAIGTDTACDAMKRRKKKNRRNKLYEQLRTGKLQVCTDDSSDDGEEDDGDDLEKEISRLVPAAVAKGIVKGGDDESYAETDNFRGMRKAERELQHDRRDHKELQIVSNMISSLLQQCRDIGLSRRRAGSGNTSVTIHKCDRERGNEEDKEDEYIRIGFVGHPNVGKSSLLNCIRGTKVVSVSSTAGHTKHLQTIPIPSENVVLIDSPGLAFPVFGLPRPLQAVFGTHQIAQTRDPQSGVAYLATHLHLERLYGLSRSDYYDDDDDDEKSSRRHGPCGAPNAWSPYELCESYARKKGYFVKRGKGTLDVHRGAIELLQEAYEGRLVLFLSPPELSWLQSSEFNNEVRPYLLLRVMPLASSV
ncbi:GTP-binding protein, putative [Trypanosoma brucei gambiense DAL972]|uniref:Guanine nucleotide-binding protein-like 1 n=1 Tax=Trypanosoma brucei gambiense (strain MHOM/CI/86/DAL972) TaxID=679716 RepID=C9ZRT2_TRYB9|nr:GTP-binding protein, putative [Trypanosoma brucei gambiense DAL972]CBH12068.1 GTP-binding protein, putative [Trypanosoma brucei gambiense DAL972]|eukprot:XP_011774351.1 GTP-binding protein, putative [Trypanosoma brucei gambiense DAL972]